jgi:glutamate decarboxylase
MQTLKQSHSRMITMASKSSAPHSSALGLDAEIMPLLTQPLPHDCFPDGTSNPDIIYQILSEELLLDGNSKQNLATFCQTWESPQVHKLMDLAIDKNLIDKDEYPQTAAIEQRCINLLADLWHAPGKPVGCSTIGSSEASMLGGMAAKWRWKARQKAAGKPTDRPNMVCGSVPGTLNFGKLKCLPATSA